VYTLLINLPLVTKKECKKNMERGEHMAAYSEGKAIVQWKNNKLVFMAGNCFALEP
jgi:hypothetical protein